MYFVGNSDVWHGAVDAMTFSGANRAEVACVVLDKGDTGDTDDEIDLDYSYSCRALESEEKNVKRTTSHLFAETIVNSFVQKSLDRTVSFVPILGIKHNAIQVVMYDAELDILLSSVELKFKYPASAQEEEMAYSVYILTWLACNFKIFSTLLDEKEMREIKSKCANFANLVKEKLHIYKTGSRFQKVRHKAYEGFRVPKTGAAMMYGYDPQLQIKRTRLH